MDHTAGIINTFKEFGGNVYHGVGSFLGKSWTWIKVAVGSIFNRDNASWMKDRCIGLAQAIYQLGGKAIRFLQTRTGVVGMLSVSSLGCAIASIGSDNAKVRVLAVPLSLATAVGAVLAFVYMD